jgi:hypothetical protein
MDYVILDKKIIIDGVNAGHFVYYEQVSPTEIKAHVSNREAEIHNITITENDIMNSIRNHFL